MTALNFHALVGLRLLFVVLIFGVRDGAFGKLRSLYVHHDALIVAKCEVRCWQMTVKRSCVKGCLVKGSSKPGSCPLKNTTLSPFAVACMEECQVDTQCPGTAKCCRHACGVTCQPAVGLEYAKGLPDIPKGPKIVERRRKRTVSIEWTPGNSSFLDEGGGRIIYLIEERHHAGKHYVEDRLSEWTPCSKSVKASQNLRHCVRPGRWYQFRVAAINANGSKGFSNNSLPYCFSISPKPPRAPSNVTIGPLLVKNGSLNVELRWNPPYSDLPIQKYKVFCSKRLHGAKALDSVLVYQHTIPRDETHFLIQNLQPDSQYFLQVQALTQYGRERLKGEKSGLVLNTTEYINSSDNNALVLEVRASGNRIDGLHLQKLFWHQGNLKARIVWRAKHNLFMYSISWWVGPCHGSTTGYTHPKYSATTRASHFDLKDLQFDCRYKVSIKKISVDGMKTKQDTSITFTTPKCTKFKASHRRIKCR